MDDITRSTADQRIREYDLRMQRLDELLDQAAQHVAQNPEEVGAGTELARLMQERDRLAGWLAETRRQPLENWREEEIRQAGPMGIWDAVAQQIEKLIERFER